MLGRIRILLLGFVFCLTNQLYAQINNIGDLIRVGVADANLLVNAYLQPVGNGFGADLNNGWYRTARPHKFLGFDITVMGSAAIAPASDETFDLNDLSLQSVRPLNAGNSITPTVVGEDQDGPQIEIFASNPFLPGGEAVLDTLTLPKGVGFRYVPSPMIQASIGIVENTEVMVRFFPEIEIDEDFGKVRMLGLGIKHGLNDWLGNGLPFDVAVMAGFTTFQSETDLEVEPDPTLPPTGATYDNQEVEIEATSVTANLVASKTLSILTLFGSLGIESSDVKLKLKGIYPVTLIDDDPNSPTFGEEATADVEDPIDLSFKNPNDVRATFGLQLHFAVLAVHASYTFANYPGLNAGVGINIR